MKKVLHPDLRTSNNLLWLKCAILLTIMPVAIYANYDFNENCIRAYQQIISLNFNEGRNIIEAEKFSNPENKIPLFLENYIEFLTLVIGENQLDFEKHKPNRSDRINLLKAANVDSPWHRHCQAAIYLQWSFARAKFGEYALAGLDLNHAYRLLKQNKSIHPDFTPDMLLDGVLNALIGSIPESYKWATRLMGIDGAIETGRAKLYRLIEISETNNHWEYLKPEAYFYLSFIEMNLQGDKTRAVSLLNRMEQDTSLDAGPLNCYLKANLCLRTGRNDRAIDILENCKVPEGSYPFHYLEYVLGSAKLNQLDMAASRHLLNYVNHHKGLNYIKSAYQRLAWLSLLDNDANAYKFYISKVYYHGHVFVDEDKQAQAEAEGNRLPNLLLLKARLLFDGGYYESALNLLEHENENAGLSEARDSIEYLYRKARIYHEMGNFPAAIHHYIQSIEHGSNLKYYFAGNASLQLGIIYENEKNFEKALEFYDLCLKMDFTEYRSSIQQKARAGRQRVLVKK